MHETADVRTMTAALTVRVTRSGREAGMATLTPLHREVVAGMPRGAEQEVRVILATLLPGDVTPYHSHRFPVTVYMIEGVFTLELDGREPIPPASAEAEAEAVARSRAASCSAAQRAVRSGAMPCTPT